MSSLLPKAHIRIARPSDNIHALRKFYIDGLGFSIVAAFTNHEGFDGLMLGHQDAAYHLEFTCKRGHVVGKAPSRDHLLVFYLPDEGEWKAAVARMVEAGFEPVESFNPYWDRMGRTFEDPDGYRVVLQGDGWENRAGAE